MSPGVRAAAALAALALACGAPAPAPIARVARVTPPGPEVPAALAQVEVAFTAPLAAAGLTDGRRLVLVPEVLAHEARTAVESPEGAVGLAGAAPGAVRLADGGRRAVLALSAPLHARTRYLLLVSSRLRTADGGPVLDAEGHHKLTEVALATGPAAGPAGRAALTELRIDAATPEAGGEYVELANLGPGPLDLFGLRLSKRTSAGGVSSCVLGEGVVAEGAAALAVGGAYDGRYAVPEGTPVLACGGAALLGGLSNEHPPAITLADGAGAVLSTLGAAGLPRCAVVVRLDPEGPDALANLACGEE